MSLVSIIIPYYKKKDDINTTINSILNQNFKNYEIIIVYDDENKNKNECGGILRIEHLRLGSSGRWGGFEAVGQCNNSISQPPSVGPWGGLVHPESPLGACS